MAVPARPQILQHAEEPLGVARAEAGGRLVQHQQPRVHRQRAGDGDELLLRRGQPPHDRARRDLRADAGELPLRIGFHPPAIQQSQRPGPVRLASEEDVAGNVERVDDLELLVDDADAEAGGIGRAVHHDRRTVDGDVARVRPMDPGQDLHQRRLAGAILPDEPDDLSGGDVEVDAIESDHAGKSLGDSPTSAVKERPSSGSCRERERTIVSGARLPEYVEK